MYWGYDTVRQCELLNFWARAKIKKTDAFDIFNILYLTYTSLTSTYVFATNALKLKSLSHTHKIKERVVGWIPHHREMLRNIFWRRLFIVCLNRFQPVRYRYGILALNGIHNFEFFVNSTITYVLHTRFVPCLIQTIARAKLYCLS